MQAHDLLAAAESGYSPAVWLSDKGTPLSFQPIERRKVYELIAEQLLAQIGSAGSRRATCSRPSAS